MTSCMTGSDSNRGYGLNFMTLGIDPEEVALTVIGEIVLADCNPDLPLIPEDIVRVTAILINDATVSLGAFFREGSDYPPLLGTKISYDYFRSLGLEQTPAGAA